MKLAGQAAIVAGGASGLGAAAARHLEGLGMNVGVIDLDPVEGLSFARADISDFGQVNAAVIALSERHGAPRLVLNTTGTGGSGLCTGPDAMVDSEVFRRVLLVNTLGSFNLVKAAGEVMAQAEPDEDGGRGVIVNTSSIVAMEGQIGTAPYAAAKGGVNAMTLPLAREFARHGIRIVTIAPGIFETPMFSNARGPMVDWLREQVVYPDRPGKAVEFAEMVAHIGCNAMLNGTVIRLDGAFRVPPGRYDWWER